MSTEFSLSDFLKTPTGMTTIGILGVTVIAAGGYYWWKNVDLSQHGFLSILGFGKKRVPPHLRDVRFNTAHRRYPA